MTNYIYQEWYNDKHRIDCGNLDINYVFNLLNAKSHILNNRYWFDSFSEEENQYKNTLHFYIYIKPSQFYSPINYIPLSELEPDLKFILLAGSNFNIKKIINYYKRHLKTFSSNYSRNEMFIIKDLSKNYKKYYELATIKDIIE